MLQSISAATFCLNTPMRPHPSRFQGALARFGTRQVAPRRRDLRVFRARVARLGESVRRESPGRRRCAWLIRCSSECRSLARISWPPHGGPPPHTRSARAGDIRCSHGLCVTRRSGTMISRGPLLCVGHRQAMASRRPQHDICVVSSGRVRRSSADAGLELSPVFAEDETFRGPTRLVTHSPFRIQEHPTRPRGEPRFLRQRNVIMNRGVPMTA